MSISSMDTNLLNDYVSGHGVLLTLKSLSNPEYTIKFTASTLHTKGINVSNEFGWDSITSDSSKQGYAVNDGDNGSTFKKQKFNSLNSTTYISLNGVIGPFMYFMLDKLIMKQAEPFDSLKLLRSLGLQGIRFNAYGGNYADVENIIYYGTWILKALSWDESNFQYANNAAKIEFNAKFAVDLQYQQYEGTIESVSNSTISQYPIKKWS